MKEQLAKVKIEHNNGKCHLYINGVNIAPMICSYEIKASANKPVTLSLELLPGELDIECDAAMLKLKGDYHVHR